MTNILLVPVVTDERLRHSEEIREPQSEGRRGDRLHRDPSSYTVYSSVFTNSTVGQVHFKGEDPGSKGSHGLAEVSRYSSGN